MDGAAVDDDDWLVIGIGILLLMRKDVDWSAGAAPADWTWPVPDMIVNAAAWPGPSGTWPAVISQEFRSQGTPHYGVDLMYRDPATHKFVAPQDTPIVAARSGTLWSVDHTARGWSIVLDHGKPWATFYQHLAKVDPDIAAAPQGRYRAAAGQGSASAPMTIQAGRRLGLMGADPTDPARVKHLHFACWYQGVGDVASVDPSSVMPRWRRTTWTR